MPPTKEYEETQVRDLFDRVDTVAEVAHVIQDEHPNEAAKLLAVSKDALSHAAPVRVPTAASLLLVSDKTVRVWVSEGLLKPRGQHRRLLLDAERLYEVLKFVRELRDQGNDRNLLKLLWQRLEDEALLDRDDLAQSLEQMRNGLATPALTSEEEEEEEEEEEKERSTRS